MSGPDATSKAEQEAIIAIPDHLRAALRIAEKLERREVELFDEVTLVCHLRVLVEDVPRLAAERDRLAAEKSLALSYLSGEGAERRGEFLRIAREAAAREESCVYSEFTTTFDAPTVVRFLESFAWERAEHDKARDELLGLAAANQTLRDALQLLWDYYLLPLPDGGKEQVLAALAAVAAPEETL